MCNFEDSVSETVGIYNYHWFMAFLWLLLLPILCATMISYSDRFIFNFDKRPFVIIVTTNFILLIIFQSWDIYIVWHTPLSVINTFLVVRYNLTGLTVVLLPCLHWNYQKWELLTCKAHLQMTSETIAS